jgi:phosphate transport system protein
MSKHTVTSFDEELTHIDRLIRDMGDLAGSMVGAAIRSLVLSDNALAQRVISDDVIMDARQRELDDRAITLIGKRQPMAQDLRAVVGAIRMAGDLERIGDLFKNIGKRVDAMDGAHLSGRTLSGLRHMADLVHEQIKTVLDGFAQNRPDLAKAVWFRDGDVDALHNSLFRELLTYMMEDPRSITPSTHLLFIAKNIERAGDHATNIAETVYFIETGETLAGPRPKADLTGALRESET